MNIAIIWNGLRIDVAKGWEFRGGEDSVALFPRGSSQQLENRDPIDSVYFACARGAGLSAVQVAKQRLERRVRQGEVEIDDATFAGLSGVRFIWSDGLSQVESWIIVHHDLVLEIQRGEPWIRSFGGESLAVDARSICAAVQVAGPQPAGRT